MQGRLSPSINNRIQAFPHNYWKDEFSLARKIGFDLIEWVVDDENNPIFYDEQINEILELSKKYDIQINSLCADIFMEKFLFKNEAKDTIKNLEILKKLIHQCSKCNIKIIELPVSWAHRSGSKVHLIKDSVKFFLDLLILKRRFSRQ